MVFCYIPLAGNVSFFSFCIDVVLPIVTNISVYGKLEMDMLQSDQIFLYIFLKVSANNLQVSAQQIYSRNGLRSVN